MPVAKAKKDEGSTGGLTMCEFQKSRRAPEYLDFDPFTVSIVAFLEGVRAVVEE